MSRDDALCPDRAVWTSFLGGTTPDANRSALLQHREECKSCRKLLYELLRNEPIPNPETGETLSYPSLKEARRIYYGKSSDEFPEISGYTIIERIDGNDGSMGIVYKAIQHEAGDRAVAIKVIRPELTSAETISRFRREIISLAHLSQHANIVAAHGSGELADGRLFLVMDFINGQTLCEFCDSRAFSIKDRLRIMVDVCRGVEAAHEERFLHRDLKPGNILVAQAVGDSRTSCVPKIIDFGLSRRLDNLSDYPKRLTQPGSPMGTLEYMSPEQARASDGVNVRADVYSLGCILYRLLTGRTPLPVRNVPLEDALRTIRETDPIRPSAAVANAPSKQIAPLLQSLKLTQKQLSTELRGDLDKVILKALRKDPNYRFKLSELIADLNRYLDDRPVEAERPSNIHRVRKFYRRNPWLCWLGMIAFILLMAWLKSTHSAATLAREKAANAEEEADRERDAKEREKSLREQEQEARADAESARNEAVENAESLELAIWIIGNALDAVNPKVSKIDSDTFVPNLLQVIGSDVNQARLGNSDAVLQLRMKAADVLVDMGELDAALPLLQGIIETCRRKFGEHGENTDLARIHLGLVYLRHNKLQEAQDIFWKIFQRVKKSHGEDHYRTLSAAHFVAATQRAGGHYPEAIFMLEQVIKRYQPDGTERDLLRTDARHQLAQIHFIQKKYDKAAEAFRLSLDEFQSIANLPADHPLALEARSDLAAVLEKQDRVPEAIQQRRKLVAVTVRQYPADSEPVARAKFNLAVLLSNAEQHEEALQLLQETLASDSDTDIGLRSLYVTAQILEKQGKAAEARSVLKHLLSKMKTQFTAENSLFINTQNQLDRLTPERGDDE